MNGFRIAILAALLVHTPAFAEGYRDWRFGMSKAEVSAVGDSSRYYAFKNGDIGAQGEPFEGYSVPVSFYFNAGKLNRVMLMPYLGADPAKGRAVWQDVYTHLKRQCDGVEVAAAGSNPADLPTALATFDAELARLQPGQRHQIGCLPMPAGVSLWASATRAADGSLMISVNYAGR